MTIDTNELRRLAQAALAGPDGISLNWIKLLQDFQQKASPAAVSELLDRLEAAESALSNLGVTPEEARDGLARHKATLARLEAAEKERDDLKAKIEQMEQQEPVAWAATDEAKTVVEALGMNQSRRFDSPLFLAPGAQPAPSVPVVTPKMEQAFYEKVEVTSFGSIRGLADGIKAAMLAAAPEAKP